MNSYLQDYIQQTIHFYSPLFTFIKASFTILTKKITYCCGHFPHHWRKTLDTTSKRRGLFWPVSQRRSEAARSRAWVEAGKLLANMTARTLGVRRQRCGKMHLTRSAPMHQALLSRPRLTTSQRTSPVIWLPSKNPLIALGGQLDLSHSTYE